MTLAAPLGSKSVCAHACMCKKAVPTPTLMMAIASPQLCSSATSQLDFSSKLAGSTPFRAGQ
jgi:hypothetical protein